MQYTVEDYDPDYEAEQADVFGVHEMNAETAKAFDEIRRAVAKKQGVAENEVSMAICVASQIPFDENNDCISCGHHEDEPGWYCPNCGEYIPNLPDSEV
jgi:hypothetical protein